ncbi:thioredoxin family protein [Bacteroidia bacterium]|nr:thioredoxin family protein [Bacteroidia bacterium]MDC1395149.1 thioredoxin family protein [Bacteroidia bacterium]
MLSYRYILFLLLHLSLANTVISQIKFQDITLDEAKNLASTSRKNIFIDFRADWCKPCIAMAKETFSDPEVGNAIHSKFIPIQVNLDYFVGMDIKEEYNVGVLPTILIINANGEVQRRLLGQKTPSSLLRELDIPYTGGGVVSVDLSETNTDGRSIKKECFLKRWWRRITK